MRAPSSELDGRVCVVTGATRGIGRATALALANLGARVVAVGRDERRLEQLAAAAAAGAGRGAIHPVRADLASLNEVRHAASEIETRWPSLHALVNNAGVNVKRRAESADGHELTFAINHLAPFALTLLLLPALERGAPSRVVNVTSVFAHMGRLDLEDLDFRRRRYDATRAYTQSKLATAMFTLELAERLAGTGVSVNCVSPGLVATHLMRDHWWFRAPVIGLLWRAPLLTAERAAERVVRVVASADLRTVTGRCFGGSARPIRFPRRACDASDRERLWAESERMTGVRGPRRR